MGASRISCKPTHSCTTQRSGETPTLPTHAQGSDNAHNIHVQVAYVVRGWESSFELAFACTQQGANQHRQKEADTSLLNCSTGLRLLGAVTI